MLSKRAYDFLKLYLSLGTIMIGASWYQFGIQTTQEFSSVIVLTAMLIAFVLECLKNWSEKSANL